MIVTTYEGRLVFPRKILPHFFLLSRFFLTPYLSADHRIRNQYLKCLTFRLRPIFVRDFHFAIQTSVKIGNCFEEILFLAADQNGYMPLPSPRIVRSHSKSQTHVSSKFEVSYKIGSGMSTSSFFPRQLD